MTNQPSWSAAWILGGVVDSSPAKKLLAVHVLRIDLRRLVVSWRVRMRRSAV